jgi:phytoene dehydrogenase-like protein
MRGVTLTADTRRWGSGATRRSNAKRPGRQGSARSGVHAILAAGDRRLKPATGRRLPIVSRDLRVAVIGAGHNGLLCALHLARSGVEVTVLEQGSEPGGHVRSGEETLPGFLHNLGAGFFPLTLASPALRSVPLEGPGVEWLTPPIAMAHAFLDGGAIALHRDLEATVGSLATVSPRAGRAWKDYMTRLIPHREELFEASWEGFRRSAPRCDSSARCGSTQSTSPAAC